MSIMDDPLPIVNGASCEGCGACCQFVGHPMFLRLVGADLHVDPHYDDLPEELKSELDDYTEGLTANDWGTPCIWLDGSTKLCRHYEHRPEMCREFELGGDDCLRIREAAFRSQATAQEKQR